jgi:hypothetical protein
MIAFQTLLLGLVFGVQPVRLMVAPQVKSVEVRLDGTTIGASVGEPWIVQCDFGESVHPHELVAIARDESGREIGRARQWVNMPRSGAEATLLLERGPQPNRVVAARLAWNEAKGARPETVRATLDGQALTVKDPKRFEIPPCDPKQAHVLSAELVFAEGRTARVDAVFGGDIGEEAKLELTGVPLLLDPGQNPPTLQEIQTWFREGDRPLRVLGIDRGPFDVVILLDQEARTLLAREHGAKGGGAQFKGVAALPPQLLFFDRAGPDDNRLFIAFGVPESYYGDDGSTHVVFPAFSPVDFVTSNVRPRLANLVYAATVMGTPTPSDAVASMGALVAANNRPRAVVLLLAGPPADRSRITPSGARAYLGDLHVPLLVWSLSGAGGSGTWGTEEDVSTEGSLDKAARRLKEDLAAQRIVWLEGAHLPQRIRLAESVTRAHLAP